MDDYDSDDLEFEIAPNPFATAGLESIEAIISHAAEDRITSKKNHQTTDDEHINQDVTPTVEELERFLCSIVSKVKPKSKEVPAFTWLRGGLRRLIVILTFQFVDFKVMRHDSLRIKVMFQTLLNDGRITKEPSRVVQWIGVILVRRLITAILEDAIDNGSTNWDKTLQKALSLLLISALSCRSGDIMTSTMDTQKLPFLCYDDITIKLVGGDGLEHLQADVLIRNEKKRKHDPKKNRTVRLHCLTESRDNVMCPIKMLIASAMRLGAINGRTIEEVLGAIRRRQDKTLQWADGRGDSPVLCAFHNQTNAVVTDKAAEVRQVINTIHTTSLKAGFCAAVTPHDMRRGAAKDAAHSKHIATGLATSAVAAELGQSAHSLNAGITAAYVGARNEDSRTKRVNAGFDDPFGINVTDTAYKRMKMTKVEMNKLYADMGTNTSSANERRKARRRHEAAQEKAWRERQGGQKLPRQQQTPDQADHGNAGVQNAPQPSAIGAAHSDHTTQSAAENIIDLIGNVEGAKENEETAQTILFTETECPMELSQELSTLGTEFVDYLTHINLIKHGVTTQKEVDIIIGKYTGNSRDDPAPFPHKCPRYKA
ncbi:hypothetical protein VE02_06282 [Pseudogymnoascus sp. 03VT05]|nr:hypothetical protein VE02_06282 [Pseudogymnoascus sp. 03VT05]